MAQPTLQLSRGVKLVIGGVCNGERWEIVVPVATDDTTLNNVNLCSQAVEDWGHNAAAPLNKMLQFTSSNVKVTFAQGEGIIAGKVPNRRDFVLGTVTGVIAQDATPLNVAGIIAFYADPAQVVAGNRMRVAKSLMPGLAKTDVQGNLIDAGIVALMEVFADLMLNGWANSNNAGAKWYRLLNGHDRGAGLAWNIIAHRSRSYLGTVKRRLLPR